MSRHTVPDKIREIGRKAFGRFGVRPVPGTWIHHQPHLHRDLETVLHPLLEPLLWDRLGKQALSKLVHQGRIT